MSLIALMMLVVLAWAGVRIVDKTGLNRWLGLLLAVPLLQLGLLVWLALADWPVHHGGGSNGDDGDDGQPFGPPARLPPPDDGP